MSKGTLPVRTDTAEQAVGPVETSRHVILGRDGVLTEDTADGKIAGIPAALVSTGMGRHAGQAVGERQVAMYEDLASPVVSLVSSSVSQEGGR